MLKELFYTMLFIFSPMIFAITIMSLINISRRYPILDKYLNKRK